MQSAYPVKLEGQVIPNPTTLKKQGSGTFGSSFLFFYILQILYY